MSHETFRYGLRKSVSLPLEDADRRVREALSEEGFGVLTEIDVEKTLAAKLGVEFRPYRILGACNPTLAHRALTQETDIGLVLPCNVVIYEGDEGDTVIAVLDPVAQMAVTGVEGIESLAEDVKNRMERVLAAL